MLNPMMGGYPPPNPYYQQPPPSYPPPGYGYSQPPPTYPDMYGSRDRDRDRERDRDRTEREKATELLMASLEKQNQILARLAGNIGKERDGKTSLEAIDLENKIKKMEMEAQLKEHQLFKQSNLEALTGNYNQPMPNRNFQQFNPYLNPGNFMFNPMNPFVRQPPFQPANMLMDPRFNPQFQKDAKNSQEKKEKAKKKKDRMAKLMMLLALQDDGPQQVIAPTETASPKKKRAPVDDDDDAPRKPKGPTKEELAIQAALDAEKAKQDEAKRLEDAAKLKKKKKMFHRALIWTWMWPVIYQRGFNKKMADKRADFSTNMQTALGANIDFAKAWAVKACDKALTLIAEPKLNCIITGKEGKPIAAKELTIRTEKIFNILKAVLEGVTTATTEELLQKQFLDFFTGISFDHGFLPPNFFSDYEISRLTFNSWAGLKGTTPFKVKLMATFFLLIRSVLHQVLLRPWNARPALQPQIKVEQFKESLRAIGSVFFYVVFEPMKGLVAAISPPGDNQKHLSMDIKVKAATPFKAFDEDNPSEDELKKKKDEIDLIMTGLLKKEQCEAFIQGKLQQFNILKALVSGWMDKVSDILHRVAAEKQKALKDKKPA
jgi:hypothetical protein